MERTLVAGPPLLRETAPSLPSPTQTTFVLRVSSEGRSLGQLRFDYGPVRVGRSPECEVRLDDRTVSRFHAVIEVGPDGAFRVKDLESSNGVRVNGRRVRGWQLSDGDTIQIGDHHLRFGLDLAEDLALYDSDAVREDVYGRTFALKPGKADTDLRERSLPGRAYLRGVGGRSRQGLRPLQYVLQRDVFLIGSGPHTDLRLGGLLTPRVCAVIIRGARGFVLQSVASRWARAARVNRAPVPRRRVLRDGDELDVGGETFVFHQAEAP
jgi:pSer/pThr/pTyr-binding forkhead associated (FHA) protein